MAAQLSPAQLQALMARLGGSSSSSSSTAPPAALDALVKLTPDQLGTDAGSATLAQVLTGTSSAHSSRVLPSPPLAPAPVSYTHLTLPTIYSV